VARKGKLPPIKATPAWPADAIERRLVANLSLLGETVDGIKNAPESKYKEQFGVIVICKDEAHQQEVSKAWLAKAMTSE
jgi:hypothetical protein